MHRTLIFFLLMIALPSPTLAADRGTTAVATVLRQTPDYGATVLQTLPRGAALQILKREGSWFQVRLPGKDASEGWVRMFDVRLGSASKSGKGGGLSSLFGFLRRGDSNSGKSVTSTIGIRGLGASDLRTARPNRRELAKLDGYRSSEARAIGFAVQGHLPERKLDYPTTNVTSGSGQR